jgi:hypothetical protein
MHASEEDLILHYYGETNDEGRVERHVSECAVCQTEFARLRRVLSLVDEPVVPAPPPSFERDVWMRLEPQLTARRQRWMPQVWAFPRWALAGAVASLVLAAFLAGRFSGPDPVAPPEANADVRGRVLLVAVVDHLDRSEMVLVELLNAELDDPGVIGLEQLRARELVAANRLYRQSAAHTGDEVIGAALEELERVLLEIANAPADLSGEDLAALRDQIGPRGLLFRVRVVQSEMRERQKSYRVIG